LLAVGAVGLHQATYWAAQAVNGTPTGHSHSYLPLAVAIATVLLAAFCASLGRSLWRAWKGHHEEPPSPAFKALWLSFATALLTVFGLQEWIESWVASAHPAGPAHVLAHIGWIGLALALLFGGLSALVLHGSRAAILILAKRRAIRKRLRPASGRGLSLPTPALRRLHVLAANRAGRAPPLASSH